jgi:hypothetical protein
LTTDRYAELRANARAHPWNGTTKPGLALIDAGDVRVGLSLNA